VCAPVRHTMCGRRCLYNRANDVYAREQPTVSVFLLRGGAEGLQRDCGHGGAGQFDCPQQSTSAITANVDVSRTQQPRARSRAATLLKHVGVLPIRFGARAPNAARSPPQPQSAVITAPGSVAPGVCARGDICARRDAVAMAWHDHPPCCHAAAARDGIAARSCAVPPPRHGSISICGADPVRGSSMCACCCWHCCCCYFAAGTVVAAAAAVFGTRGSRGAQSAAARRST
jgi:hypothetical protein